MATKKFLHYSRTDWFRKYFSSSKDPYYWKVRRAYNHMRERCLNPTDKGYKNYGGRGITICNRWLGQDGFHNFVSDMRVPDDMGLSIDRIDVNKGYSPENCRWADKDTQMKNTTRNVYHVFNGEKMTLTDIARVVGINHQTLFQRIHAYGWAIDKAINTPVRKRG